MIKRWEEAKEKKRKDNPLELTEKDKEKIKGMIIGGNERTEIAWKIYENHQAEGTELLYGRTIKSLENFVNQTEKNMIMTILRRRRLLTL